MAMTVRSNVGTAMIDPVAATEPKTVGCCIQRLDRTSYGALAHEGMSSIVTAPNVRDPSSRELLSHRKVPSTKSCRV